MTAPVLPHSLDAERAVLGAILFSGRTLESVVDVLAPGDFYHPAHEAVYQAALALNAASQPVDILTVSEHMRAADTIGKIRAQGGEAYLAEMSSSVATVENIAHHAAIVREKAQRRRIILTFSGLRDRAMSEQEDVGAALEQVEAALTEITRPNQRIARRSLDAWCADEAHTLRQRHKEKKKRPGACTGFWELDDYTAGWQPGDFDVVAARPSMGKTAFVMSSAVNGATADGTPHLLLSAEMSGGAIAQRAISSGAEIPLGTLRHRGLAYKNEPSVRDMLARWRREGARLPVQVAECRSPTLAEIRREVRRWHREIGGRMGVVWLDYLQLVRAVSKGNRQQNREREVAEISAGLKEIAQELKVAMVALSQLSRGCEEREDKRPVSSDLRDSGALEQDADLIVCLYREEHYKPRTDKVGQAEALIRKQRNGPTGTVLLRYEAPYTRFTDWEQKPVNVPGIEQEEGTQ